jgi:hypothetical protein
MFAEKQINTRQKPPVFLKRSFTEFIRCKYKPIIYEKASI